MASHVRRAAASAVFRRLRPAPATAALVGLGLGVGGAVRTRAARAEPDADAALKELLAATGPAVEALEQYSQRKAVLDATTAAADALEGTALAAGLLAVDQAAAPVAAVHDSVQAQANRKNARAAKAKAPKAVAVHPWQTGNAGELQFETGAEIVVTSETPGGGWWTGKLAADGSEATGIFPKNYVQTMAVSHPAILCDASLSLFSWGCS